MPVETVPSLFLRAATTFKKDAAFQYKKRDRVRSEYVDVSHSEMLTAVEKATRGLLASHLVKGDRIALLSENRLEWAIADLAILSAGCVNVPVYATLPANQVEYILKDSEARAVFVSDQTQYEKIRSIRERLPSLLHVFSFEQLEAEPPIQTLGDLMVEGTRLNNESTFERRISTIDKNDWASIIYTSGTTGDPKGTILTHWNFVSGVQIATDAFDMVPEDRCLSFLPLSHVFERTCGYYAMLHCGVTIAYAESMDTLTDDMAEVSPTVMISVPRLYEKIYARVLDTATAGSALKKNLFFWGVGVGKKYVTELLQDRVKPQTKLEYRVASRLVFKKLRARTGGKLRFFVSGGAALARDIAEFFYAAGLPVLEGYGLTETAAITSANLFGAFKFGTIGKPFPGVEVKIAEDGEILIKGPNVTQGYFKKPDITKETIRDGWLYTGDIGYIDDDGFIVITDRKKDIIVTSGGKNVAPQPIEGLLKTSKYITQAVVLGNQRNFISAVLVPNFENLTAFADAAGIPYENESDLVRHPAVIKKIGEEIERKSEHLAGFERVKKFILADTDFSIEKDELTPTLKVKRRAIEKKFQREIDALYEE
ncbi:MAG: long-chain fatty acid--CoA ligase [Candidatus Latescibacterota bacterium]|nr:MAG: long-chain fatty acid--CoA ligase [Candidatus Latescibacterota bacterium]